MGVKSYKDHASDYEFLLERYSSVEEMGRGGEISFRVIAGCPEEGLEPDVRVIQLAYWLVNQPKQLGAQAERNAVNALLHTTCFLVAEREAERKKPFTDQELVEMVIDVMPLVMENKGQLAQQIARAGKARDLKR